ncbi:unnamed protein product [Rotaria sordida]|uniref:G-protein coupled receptors family 1 profile domain-containing protein n=1 Tax=Rotaria sordida TaxID=392033 RepID=A0A814GW36_9BILA|nr:unnamed protein product [Rotaria sordida]
MEYGIVGFVLTLISLINSSFATVISVIVIGIIIYHQYHNRLRREEKITLILSANIYFFMNIYVVILISSNIQTLLGDIYEKNFDSSWCKFRGYLLLVACCALFHGFVIQAFFRLHRIVYSNRRWVQSFWFYVIAIPVQLVGAFIVLCPILIWHDIIYLPNEYYCFPAFTKTRGILWFVTIGYGLPLLLLSLMYLRITIFIRQQPNNQTLMVKQRQQRDLAAIQRICINVGLLFVLGIPGVILLIMCFITGIEYPLTYRILWFGPEVSMAILSIQMAFYRLCRIVYSNHRWVQFYWLYIIAIPVQLVGAFIALCPILIWHDVIYLPNEYYCFVPFTKIRGFLWLLLIAYGLPLLLLSLIYLRITIFIRQQPSNQTLMVKQRQQRDLAAIQRIFINVGLLLVVGTPCVILLIIYFITGIEHPLTYRITWVGPEVSMAILSIQMIFMTPQLKNLIIIKRRQNRVTTLDTTIQMRAIVTNQ